MANVNSAPRGRLQGVRDDSIRQIPPVSEQLPTHLAWFLTYAQKGGELVEFVDGTQFDSVFGSSTKDFYGPYASHTTPFIVGGLGTGTILAVQRLFPKDMAPAATLAFGLDILPTQVQQYVRDEFTKELILDQNGQKQPLTENDVPVTRPGFKVIWKVGTVPRVNKDGVIITPATEDKVPVANKFGVASVTVGTQATEVNGEAVLSQFYPIYELGTSSRGKNGNNQGVCLFAAHDQTVAADTEALQGRLGEFLYGLQFVERASEAADGRILSTINSAAYALFTASNLSIDETLNMDYGYGSLMSNWNVNDRLGKTVGAFSDLHVYEDNIVTIQNMIADAEAAIDLDFTATGKQINFVDFRTLFGVPYHAVEQLGAMDGGVLLNDTAEFFAQGGTDGTMSPALFEELALEQIANFGKMAGKPYLDYVRYPFHHVYDSGYSADVKEAIPSITGKRYDMIAVLSTQDVALPLNGAAEDSAALIGLVSRARTFPESTLFGTSNFRTSVVQQAGYDATRLWRKPLPLVYEIFINFCTYMGAANGRWKSAKAPDVFPNNVVSRLTGLLHTYKDDRPYTSDWNNGAIFAISNDRSTDMIPALRTIYPEPTSILVSLINANVFGDLEFLTQVAWRRVVGDATLSKSERLEKQEKVMNDLIRERGGYDGRVTIQLRAYYTAEDDLNGFSSHLDVTVGGNNMPTVQTFTLIAQRAEDLAQA